jgi:hypothetical protein
VVRSAPSWPSSRPRGWWSLVETEPPEEKETACTMDIRFETVSVTLDEPLGERTVVLKYEHRKG